jgi:hypothetical protein
MSAFGFGIVVVGILWMIEYSSWKLSPGICKARASGRSAETVMAAAPRYTGDLLRVDHFG